MNALHLVFAGPEPVTSTIRWHDPAVELPDADESVLLWLIDDEGGEDWDKGWLDDEQWRSAEGFPIEASAVRYWGEVEEPTP